jgi:PTS system mannose-specific IIA component
VHLLELGPAEPAAGAPGLATDRLMCLGLPLSFVVLAAPSCGGRRRAAAGRCWALFCMTSTFVSLVAAGGGHGLSAALAGRALSAYNLVIFAGVFRGAVGHRPAGRRLRRAGLGTVDAFRRHGRVPGAAAVASYGGFCWPAPDNQASFHEQAILIIAHAPLAHALRQCALHVFPDCAATSWPRWTSSPTCRPTRPWARRASAGPAGRRAAKGVLVLTDVFGATPCNVAQRLVDGVSARGSGRRQPAHAAARVSYRHEPLDALAHARRGRRHPGRDAGGHHRAAEPG